MFVSNISTKLDPTFKPDSIQHSDLDQTNTGIYFPIVLMHKRLFSNENINERDLTIIFFPVIPSFCLKVIVWKLKCITNITECV